MDVDPKPPIFSLGVLPAKKAMAPDSRAPSKPVDSVVMSHFSAVCTARMKRLAARRS